jgi:tetratricopeptide (TPR) repeat protein
MSPANPAAQPGPRAQALAVVQEAQAALEGGRIAAARAAAERGVALARAGQDTHVLGWSLMLLGRTLNILGEDLLQVHAAASEAYRLLGACADVPRQLWALNTCANVEIASGNSVRSVELLQQGLAAAQGPGCRVIKGVMLVNLSNRLADDGEFAETIRCAADAAELAGQDGSWQGQDIDALTRLAVMHCHYAKALRTEGRHDEAALQWQAAAAVLPALEPRAWRSLSPNELSALHQQPAVLGWLAQWPKARSAAAATLWSIRQRGGGYREQALGLAAVSAMHESAGQLRKAIAYEQRFVDLKRASNDRTPLHLSLSRLAAMHAQIAAFDSALAYCKEVRQLRSQQHQQASALRSRLATIERHNERRRQEAKEALAHTQRLVVVGHLIAQTHHALNTPIERAKALTDAALAASDAGGMHDLQGLLNQINLTIDRAAGLVSQLKLFSHRSAPQPTALLVRAALRDAWDGLAPHVGRPDVAIDIADGAPLHAWADTQRLGILLKVLLIEIVQMTGLASICARIEAEAPGAVVLQVQADGRLPVAKPSAGPSLGITLCEQMAAELGGSLDAAHDSTALRFLLRLPEARRRAQELPRDMGAP